MSYDGAAEAVLSYEAEQAGGPTERQSSDVPPGEFEVDPDTDPSLGTGVKIADRAALDRFLDVLGEELTDAQLEELVALGSGGGGVLGDAYRAAKVVLEREEFADPGGDGPRFPRDTNDRPVFLGRAAALVLERQEEQRQEEARRREIRRRRQRAAARRQADGGTVRQQQTIGGLTERQTLALIVGAVLVVWLMTGTAEG